MNIGLVGGIVGSVLGLAGGLFGTYSSYRRAKSSRERRFVIWASISIFVYVGSFLAVLFLFPRSRPMIFVPYALILSSGIVYLNRRQSRIQQEQQTR
jgi:membrane protease YdiL (CAAX protease family)